MSDSIGPSGPGGLSRRHFLQAGSVAAAGAVASNLGVVRAANPGGSDTLRVAVVGCGGRGKGAVVDALTAGQDAVRIVALADTFRGQIDRCYEYIQRRGAGDRLDVPEERRFVGLDAYQKVLQTDCDLVILATPPGFRPAHLEACINAGKHVFTEKPLAVDAPGVRRVLAAGKQAEEKGLAVGVGLQRRHDPKYIEAITRIQDGAIGDFRLSRVYWNGGGLWVRSRADFARANGYEPNELEYQLYNWYYFNWLCGDHIVEQHIHNIDVSNWARGDMHPVKANGMGGREQRTGRDHGQIFDHHFVEFTYPDGGSMMSQCRQQNGCWTAVQEDIVGTKGRAELGDRKPCAVYVGDQSFAYQGDQRGFSPYPQEHVDLQRSIREGTPLNEVEYGAHATMTAILGRMATYSGKEVTWEEAINSDVALMPTEVLAMSDPPPVKPSEDGHYPIPQPGRTKVV